MPKRYWLFKTEPSAFSIADLAAAPKKTSSWDGVRNYQARNSLRDDVSVGDDVLIYHSSSDVIGVAGTATVVRAAYPDPTAYDPKHHHFDPKSKADAPTWFMVDVKLAKTFKRIITREDLAADPVCRDMLVMKRGSRLSIQPVTAPQFSAVIRLASGA